MASLGRQTLLRLFLMFNMLFAMVDLQDDGYHSVLTVDGHNESLSSDNARPKSSLNRWKSESSQLLKPAPFPSESSDVPQSDKQVQNVDEADKYKRKTVSSVNDQYNPYKKPAKTSTLRPNVDQALKKSVEWFDDTQYYALKASTDTRFRIRHAPIPEPGSPWPMPQLYEPYNVSFRINPFYFDFHSVGEPCDLLEMNFKRIMMNIFGSIPDVDSKQQQQSFPHGNWEGGGSFGDLRSLNVTVLKECTEYPYLEMDESYDLEVKKTGVSIITREVWGALRGMETFSQIVYQDEEGHFWVNKTYIHDYPRFKHRGILLDTSRHYLDKKTLLDNLEAMAQNKMNVFHWHIVDDQSFPYESKVYPNLTRLGSYHERTHIYSHKDIAEIIEHARVRGIRVIPEFDTPGHTFSWGYGQDHLLTPCYNYKREPNGMYGPINPILKKTYSFLRGLFAEIVDVFKDKYVHLGGDEVPFDCWQSNPFLQNFMKRNNLSDIKELLNLYERELLKIVTDVGRERPDGTGYIVWQELFDNGVKNYLHSRIFKKAAEVKPDTIVQIWSGDSYNIDRVTKSGLRALFSTCWYLDYINYGQDWDKYYRCEQVGSQLDDYRVRNQSLLIGGEACLWTEYADDDIIMPRLWPRASAAAERLWSDRRLVDVHKAAPRIEEQRCRMIRRGLHVGVLSGPGYCTKHKKLRKEQMVSPDDPALFDAQEGIQEPVRYFHRDSSEEAKQADPIKNSFLATDSSAIYTIPVAMLVVFAIIVIIIFVFRGSAKSRMLAVIFNQPVSCELQRRFVYILIFVTILWCIWMAHIWFHVLEKSPHPKHSEWLQQ